MTATTTDAWLLSIFDHIDNPPDMVAIKAIEAVKAQSSPAPKSKLCSCGRCGGTGVINHYRRVNGGVCFKCNGLGYLNN
jgi:hypothetical protein